MKLPDQWYYFDCSNIKNLQTVFTYLSYKYLNKHIWIALSNVNPSVYLDIGYKKYTLFTGPLYISQHN